MMCAMELTAINFASKEIERKRREELIASAGARTIDFCEKEIGPVLCEKAKKASCDYIETNILFGVGSIDGVDVLYPLKDRGALYANGTHSFDEDTNKPMLKSVFTEYLSKHCLTVEWVKGYYHTYGCGQYSGQRMYVSVPPVK